MPPIHRLAATERGHGQEGSHALVTQHTGGYNLGHSSIIRFVLIRLPSFLPVINGTHPTLRGDPYSPGSVLRALSTLGWVIELHEHDSPELLTAILTAAEEEATKPKKPIGGLSDALLGGGFDKPLSVDVNFDETAPYARQQPRPSSAMMTDFCNADYSENVVRHTRSEAHTPDSPHSTCTELDETSANSLLDDTLENSSLMRPIGRVRTTSTGDDAMKNFQMNLLSQKKSSISMERLSRGPGKVSVFSEKANIQVSAKERE